MQLNPPQQRAVDAIAGPVLVLAGAGSGKTSVITRKIVHLIKNCGFAPDSIAAVTFTNKAAREMQQRLTKVLGQDLGAQVRTSTFHTLGMAILRQDIGRFDRSHKFTIFDEQDAMKVLQDLTERQLKGDKNALYQLKQRISDWKNASRTPDQVIAGADDQQILYDGHVYQAYQEHLMLCNAVDFDDLIALPVQLLQADESVRYAWQKRIRYLLVDEYQDTNEAQYQLVKLLAGPDPRFTVVGDDDQSIYAWRGAKPENLHQLQTDYPTLEVIKLEQNYRCSQRVLRVANHLIANNDHLFEKSLWSEHILGDPVRILELEDEEVEAETVVTDIIARRLDKGQAYSDFAILYRGNHQAKLFEKTLIKHRIPYQISGGTSFFARAEIRDMMAYFRLLSNPDDDAACQRIINVPRRGIGSRTLQSLARYGRDHKLSLFQVCRQAGKLNDLGSRAQSALADFVHMIDTYRTISSLDARDFARRLGYDDWLLELASTPQVAEGRWNNVMELCRWINEGLQEPANEDLADVINQLMIRELQQQEEQTDGVQLLTLHAAKGLEFSHVYMVGMEEELLPHRSAIEEENIDEERRLCYVGITRAKQYLTLTLAKRRRRFGDVISTEASRFLQELPIDDLDWAAQRKELSETEQQDQNQMFRDRLAALFDD